MASIEEEFMDSKYHLAVARRLLQNYSKFGSKRLLVGVINEMARSVSSLIRAFLLLEGKKRLSSFIKEISKRYLDSETSENLLKILEIEKAQKTSPVEFARGNKIILLIQGKYRFLTVERLGEFLNSAEVATAKFPRNFRQI